MAKPNRRKWTPERRAKWEATLAAKRNARNQTHWHDDETGIIGDVLHQLKQLSGAGRAYVYARLGEAN